MRGEECDCRLLRQQLAEYRQREEDSQERCKRERSEREQERRDHLRESQRTASSWGEAFQKCSSLLRGEIAIDCLEADETGRTPFFSVALDAVNRAGELWKEKKIQLEMFEKQLLAEMVGQLEKEFADGDGGQRMIIDALQNADMDHLLDW